MNKEKLRREKLAFKPSKDNVLEKYKYLQREESLSVIQEDDNEALDQTPQTMKKFKDVKFSVLNDAHCVM